MNPVNRYTAVALLAAGLAFAGCSRTPETEGVAREFSARTTAGNEVSGESIRGRVTIIDFWGVF